MWKNRAVSSHFGWPNFAWHAWQSACGASLSISSVGRAMSCFPWHVSHSGQPCAWNAFLCGLPSKRLPFAAWQVRQTCDTNSVCGGSAAWFPWQPLHAGAPASCFPRSARPCTLFLYCSS